MRRWTGSLVAARPIASAMSNKNAVGTNTVEASRMRAKGARSASRPGPAYGVCVPGRKQEREHFKFVRRQIANDLQLDPTQQPAFGRINIQFPPLTLLKPSTDVERKKFRCLPIGPPIEPLNVFKPWP